MKMRYCVISSFISGFLGCLIPITASTPPFSEQWTTHLINAYIVTFVVLAVDWIGILIVLILLRKREASA